MSKLTILVVDDIEMNRNIINRIFENDFHILQASDGGEALKLVEKEQVDIVITDVFMEPMDGYELIRHLREKEEYKKIPIIAVTESDLASRKKALKAGADDLLYKPFIASILVDRVQGLLIDGFDLNRYRLAYENNPVAFVVYHVIDRPDTPNYKILYMNRAARNYYSPPYVEDHPETDERPEIRDLLLRAVRNGSTERSAIFEPDLNKWLDWTIYADGRGLVASMVHDITGEIEKQTELANFQAKEAIKEKNYVSNIMEHIPSGIFVFKVSKDDLIIEEANTTGCKLLDIDPIKAIGVHKDVIMSFVHPDDHHAVLQAMHDVLTPEHTAYYTCRILNRSKNDYVWFSAQAYGTKQPDGSVYAYITYTDITLERELNETKMNLLVAQKANQEKTDFLSRVSHDMRTPLNGILGLTSMLKEKVTDEDALKDLAQLEIAEQYLNNLITDTLDVAKIENGKLELRPSVCDGRAVFNAVLDLIKPEIEKKHLHFIIKAENLPFNYLYLDVGRVEQIVMNLFSNAIKFTPQGGTITFTMENVSIENGIITDRVTVEDTGCGMSKEFLPHIYEAFAQEHNGITSNINGSGLGMAITKEIVQLLGGTISVESEEGKGTKFTILLPMNIATDEQIKAWKESNQIVYDGEMLSEKRILLCEDHPLNATIAQRLLEKKDMHVETAVNGEIGLKMFEESTEGYYDAILMDIRMPVMDGITATKKIRALPRVDAKTIPIIAMTANVLEDDIQKTREAGMDEHLSKPIDTNKLYGTLEKMMKLKRSFKQQKVLIVDDVEVNREVLKTSLQDDYAILEANNGKEALEILHTTYGIDVVITDIQMPEMNGVDLIKAIRSERIFHRVAIIANTQYGDMAQEESLLDIGANDFIYKPTTPLVVKARVASVLKK